MATDPSDAAASAAPGRPATDSTAAESTPLASTSGDGKAADRSGLHDATGTPITLLRPPFDAAAEARLRQALRAGAVMSYPTETFYALGGNALDAALVAEVYRLKGRPPDKSLLLLVDGKAVGGLAAEVPPVARQLMAACWPGPLTLVFRAGPALPAHLRCDDGTPEGSIALRSSPHPVVRRLLALGGVPLIGTSANRSGQPSASTWAAVQAAFPRGIALGVDAGATAGGAPSSVVDVTRDPPRLLREGAYSIQELAALLGRPVLRGEAAE